MEEVDPEIAALLGNAPKKSKTSDDVAVDDDISALLDKPVKVEEVKETVDEEPKPKESLTSLMRKSDDGVVDTLSAPYRARFEERSKKALSLDNLYFSKRKELDEKDNALLDNIDNISKKYNIERGDLVAYALADGWIPKGESGAGKIITGTASDVAFNADTLVERELQDKIFDPRAVQAITETRRAVQDTFGLARMGTQLAGEVVAAVPVALATGGAAAPAIGAKVAAKAIGKTAASAGVQSGLTGGMSGIAMRDNEAAVGDEQFEKDKRTKEVASDEARSRFDPIRIGNEVSRAASDNIGKLYANKVASSPQYQQFKETYPKTTSFVEGAVPATVMGVTTGGVIGSLPLVAKGVRNAVSKETRTSPQIIDKVAREMATAKSVEELSPQAQQFVAKVMPNETPTIEQARQTIFKTQPLPQEVAQDIARSASVKELTPESRQYLESTYGNAKKGYRVLVQPVRKAAELETAIVDNALPKIDNVPTTETGNLSQDFMETTLNSVRANADGTMSDQARTVRGLIDQYNNAFNYGLDVRGAAHKSLLSEHANGAEEAGNKTLAKVLRSLANKDSAFLNDGDAVLKALGATDDLSTLAADRSPVVRAFQTNLADQSYNAYYEMQLIELLKLQHLNLKTADDVTKYIKGKFELNPSSKLTQLDEAVNFARDSGNAVDVKATLANKDTLAPQDVAATLDTYGAKITENEFDKAYNNRDVLSVNRELKDAQARVKSAQKEADNLKADEKKLHAQYLSTAQDIEKRLLTVKMRNTVDEMTLVKEEISAALSNEERIPADIIRFIEQDADLNTGSGNDVRALANMVKSYNNKFEQMEKANIAFLNAQEKVVQLNNALDQYPELRGAGYDEVKKVVNYYTRILNERGEKADALVGQLKEQTDTLVFGSDMVQRDILSDVFDTTMYRGLVDRMEMALLSETPVPIDVISGFRDFAKMLRENNAIREQLAKVVRSSDKIDRISDNLDNIADSLDMLARDKEYFTNVVTDLTNKAQDAKGMAATKLAIINRNLKQLGYNRKTVAELEKMKAALMPVLEERMNGAGLTSTQKRKIVSFLESDIFERVRQFSNDPDWAIYADEQVDNMLDVQNKLGPLLQNHMAASYLQATGKPLPTHTFYAHLLTPDRVVDGADVRLKSILDIAASVKNKALDPKQQNMREYGNSEIVNNIISNSTGLATFRETSAFHADLRIARREANNLTVEHIESLDKLRAFDKSSYKSHQNTQEFVEARYRIMGVNGADNEKFPFFTFDAEEKIISPSGMYKMMDDFVTMNKSKKYLDFTAPELTDIAAKYFPDNAVEAASYMRSYFGQQQLQFLRPSTMDLALKSSFEAKVFDYKRLQGFNKIQLQINASRGVNYPPMEYRADRVQYTLLTQDNDNISPADALQNLSYNFISSSRTGQTTKTDGVLIKDLMHPDMATAHQTHGLARKILLRDSTQRLEQKGMLSARMGYVFDAKSVNHLIAGQISVQGDVKGLNRFIENVENMIIRVGGRTSFTTYQAFKSLTQTFVSAALSQPTGQVINVGQATFFGGILGSKKNPRAIAGALAFAPKVAGAAVASVARDVGVYAKYRANQIGNYVATYPWKTTARLAWQEAGAYAKQVGDTSLEREINGGFGRDTVILDYLDLDTNAIVNNTLSEVIETDNAVQFKFRLQEAINAGKLSKIDESIGKPIQNAMSGLSEFFAKRADSVSTQIKERVETTMMHTHFKNAARVYNVIVEDVVDSVTRGEINSIPEISNALVDSWNRHSLIAGETQVDVRSFANQIANEFAKPPEKRNYNVAMRDFLLYSNDMMQGRFGSASNPIAINNLAKSIPGVNQFFAPITAGAMRVVRLATQGKGALTERDYNFARALGGAASVSAAIAVLEFGVGKRLADGYADLQSDFDEGRREYARTSRFIDLILAGHITPAAYKFLAGGTGYPLWSMFDPVGSVVGSGMRGAASSREKGELERVIKSFGNLPRMGGMGLSVGAELMQSILQAAKLPFKEFEGTPEQQLKAKAEEVEQVRGNAASKALQLIIPVRDLVNNPMVAFSLLTDDEFRKAMEFRMLNEKGGAFAERGAIEKMLVAAKVKDERYIKAAADLNTIFNLYNWMNLNKFAEGIKEHEREHISHYGENIREVLREVQKKDMKMLEEVEKSGVGEVDKRRRLNIIMERITRENYSEASDQGLREISK